MAHRLSLPNFPKATFIHHDLINDINGVKLSKSAGSSSCAAMRASGESPSVVVKIVAQMIGADGAQSLDEIIGCGELIDYYQREGAKVV
jgi:glutamyl/glutaminyl-tRNA synthetase